MRRALPSARELLDWWNAYWFPVSSSLNLAGARIVTVAFAMLVSFPSLRYNINLAVKNSAGKVLMRRSIAGRTAMAMKVRLEAGTYELGCFEPGHYAAGMHKTLTVAAAT